MLLSRTRPSFGLLSAACFGWAAISVFLTGMAGSSVPLLIGTMLAVGIGVVGGQNLSHALSSEFYPTGVRATGVGWALGIGRIGSIIGPTLGGYLLTRGAPRQVLWAAAIPRRCGGAAAMTVDHQIAYPAQTP